jgi:hypothetical protein
MRAVPEPIDFERLVREMRASVCADCDWPTVRGGVWDSEVEVVRQLESYQNSEALPWHIWEYTDSCTLGQGWLTQDVQWLERARLFGEGGDLDVRRDGGRFLWRYVGEPDQTPPGGAELQPDGKSPIYSRERTALLWGTRERDQKQWFDDRVSGASLTYFPDPPSLPEKVEERVQVRFREYTQAGRTLVVWLRKLEPYGTEEGNDG